MLILNAHERVFFCFRGTITCCCCRCHCCRGHSHWPGPEMTDDFSALDSASTQGDGDKHVGVGDHPLLLEIVSFIYKHAKCQMSSQFQFVSQIPFCTSATCSGQERGSTCLVWTVRRPRGWATERCGSNMRKIVEGMFSRERVFGWDEIRGGMRSHMKQSLFVIPLNQVAGSSLNFTVFSGHFLRGTCR